jgi:SlyX protein
LSQYDKGTVLAAPVQRSNNSHYPSPNKRARTGPIKKGSKTVEERFINIEIKLANQEHLIDQLNIIIYEQQMKIDRLERVLKELEKASTFEVGQHNVKPPHY